MAGDGADWAEIVISFRILDLVFGISLVFGGWRLELSPNVPAFSEHHDKACFDFFSAFTLS